MGIAQRSISSITWRSGSNWIGRLVLLTRAILLARWLPVYVFGILAFAGSIAGIGLSVANFGMSNVFLNRSSETADEDETAAILFTLNLFSGLGLSVILLLGAYCFSTGSLRMVLSVLAGTSFLKQILVTPKRILVRRVVHRRLAVMELFAVVFSTVVSVGLALRGETIWALLSIEITIVLIEIVILYFWRPVWKPRLLWKPDLVRYFLKFGSRYFLSNLLIRALNQADDLWVGGFLGDKLLGYYSKAYGFAIYPREIIAGPIRSVAAGIYAELATDRQRLSKAFFLVNAFLIRSGFLLAGLLYLVAPELIRILLGVKWLPMLDVFRIMLLFTLFDPVKTTMENIFVALGKPDQLNKILLAQFAVMLIGILVLGPLMGIIGVALAVDGMVIFGIGLLFWRLREYVDYSIWKQFLSPLIALSVGIALAFQAMQFPQALGSDWRTAGVKVSVFAVVYILGLVLLEFKQLKAMMEYLLGIIHQDMKAKNKIST